jgi:hypothetical protein
MLVLAALFLMLAGVAEAAGATFQTVPTHEIPQPSFEPPKIIGQPVRHPTAAAPVPPVSLGEGSWWRRLWTDPIATFTMAVAIFTATLAAVSIYQGVQLRRTALAARITAETAEKALVNLDRPHVFVDNLFPRVLLSSYRPHIPYVEFTINNYGRSPGFIKRRRIGLTLTDEIPEDMPIEKAIDVTDWAPIASGGWLKDTQTAKVPYPADGDIIKRISALELRCLFFGSIDYEDIIGNHYTTKFGWIFQPSDGTSISNECFVACDKPGYNEST